LEAESLEDGPYEDPRLLEEADEERPNPHRFLHELLSLTCSHRRRYHRHCPCCTKSGRTPLRNRNRCRDLGRRRWAGKRLGGRCGLPCLSVESEWLNWLVVAGVDVMMVVRRVCKRSFEERQTFDKVGAVSARGAFA